VDLIGDLVLPLPPIADEGVDEGPLDEDEDDGGRAQDPDDEEVALLARDVALGGEGVLVAAGAGAEEHEQPREQRQGGEKPQQMTPTNAHRPPQAPNRPAQGGGAESGPPFESHTRYDVPPAG
jgi:hypothetical protein